MPSSVDAKADRTKREQQYDNYKCGKRSLFSWLVLLIKNKNKIKSIINEDQKRVNPEKKCLIAPALWLHTIKTKFVI